MQLKAYKNYPISDHCTLKKKPVTNQLTGFYMSTTLGWYGLKTNARDCYAFANIRSITVNEKNMISSYTHKKHNNKFFCF